MWRLLFMIAMLLHGIGHVLFLMNTWGYWKDANGRAGLFSDVLALSQAGEGIIGLLWLVPLAGFVIGTWGLFNQDAWWAPLALATAILSSVMLLLWWGSLNISSAFFALVFNLVVLAAAVWQQRLAQPAGA
jgi:hypothetical protein